MADAGARSAIDSLDLNEASTVTALRAALLSWANVAPAQSKTDYLVYMFKHKYADAKLCVGNLKADDLDVATALQELSEEVGYVMCLASMEKFATGACEESQETIDGRKRRQERRESWPWSHDEYVAEYGNDDDDDYDTGATHYITDLEDESLTLKRIFDLHGKQLVKDIIIEEENIIQDYPYEDRDPDDEDYEPPEEDRGPFTTHRYRDTVLVLVRQEAAFDFLLSPHLTGSRLGPKHDQTVINLIRTHAAKFPDSIKGERAKAKLRQLCSVIVEHNRAPLRNTGYYGSHAFSPEVIGEVLIALLGLNEAATPQDLAKAASATWQLSQKAMRALNEAMRDTHAFAAIQPALTAAAKKHTSISAHFIFVQELFAGEEQICSNDAERWADQSLTAVVKSASRVDAADGAALAPIILRLGSPTAVNEIFQRHENNTRFFLAFLVQWTEGASAEASANQDLDQEVFVSAWTSMIRCFNLRDTWPEPDGLQKDHGGHDIPDQLVTLIARFVAADSMVVDMEPESLASELLAAINHSTTESACPPFHILLPFLRQLQTLARVHLSDTLRDAFRATFTTTLSAYVADFTGPEPSSEIDYRLSSLHWRCTDCQDLNAFFKSEQQVGPFVVDEKRHQHLLQQLTHCGSCTHESEQSGGKQQLVVTKAGRVNDEYARWSQRCEHAREEIGDFDQALLKEMLGERYEEVVGLKTAAVRPGSEQSVEKVAPLQELRNPPSGASMGSKREAEEADDDGAVAKRPRIDVVDLCDSE